MQHGLSAASAHTASSLADPVCRGYTLTRVTHGLDVYTVDRDLYGRPGSSSSYIPHERYHGLLHAACHGAQHDLSGKMPERVSKVAPWADMCAALPT
jgi:hypothetical protein